MPPFNLESSPLMQRIVELKEKGFADKDAFDYAPEDYADAIDSYNRVLEVAGDITANTIFPNSEDVDAEGPHCEDDRVRYASKTYENLEATRKTGLNGVTMPRRFGGLNFPITAYTAINEMIASADAGFENIWSLQDCIETLYEFDDEDQRSRFIPRVCAGETMSMDLTEPDAGSDLQRVMLKATYSEEDKCDGGVYVRRIKNRRSSTRIDNNCTFVYLFFCIKKNEQTKAYYFFDEAGDTTILGRKGVNLVESGLASKVFMVGYLETKNPQPLTKSITALHKEICEDEIRAAFSRLIKNNIQRFTSSRKGISITTFHLLFKYFV